MKQVARPRSTLEEAAEKTLLVRYLDGYDEEAFEAIDRHFRTHLENYARRYMRDDFVADAEDIVQETFLDLYRYRDQLEPGTQLWALLYRMVENNCGNHIAAARRAKRDYRRTMHPDGWRDDSDATGPEYRAAGLAGLLADPKTDPARQQDQFFIEEMMQMLPPKQHRALTLAWLEGHTIESAADIMDDPPSSVKWWIRKGMETLRGLGGQ